MTSSLKCIGSRIIGCGALCVVTLLCQPYAFADSVLGITDGNQLISFNSSNPAGATAIGTLDVTATPLGLFKNGSSLYVYDLNNNVVRQINPSTAATISTINIGLQASPGEGDVVFSNGTGFLASTLQPNGSFINGSGTLFSFTLTANSAHVISTTIPFIDGLTVANGVLYGLAQGGAELYTINTTTGTVTPVGATGVSGTFSVGGLTTALDGALYADLTNFQNATSEFFTIDPATGKATFVGNIPFSRVSGLVDNSTSNGTSPEPSTFFLALSGGLLLAFALRRKYQALRAQ
jgi:hypothetical protein